MCDRVNVHAQISYFIMRERPTRTILHLLPLFLYFPQPNVWPGYGKNKQSIGELWLGFLRFYVEKFDFARNVVAMKQLKTLSKFQKGWSHATMCIEGKIYWSLYFICIYVWGLLIYRSQNYCKICFEWEMSLTFYITFLHFIWSSLHFL